MTKHRTTKHINESIQALSWDSLGDVVYVFSLFPTRPWVPSKEKTHTHTQTHTHTHTRATCRHLPSPRTIPIKRLCSVLFYLSIYLSYLLVFFPSLSLLETHDRDMGCQGTCGDYGESAENPGSIDDTRAGCKGTSLMARSQCLRHTKSLGHAIFPFRWGALSPDVPIQPNFSEIPHPKTPQTN